MTQQHLATPCYTIALHYRTILFLTVAKPHAAQTWQCTTNTVLYPSKQLVTSHIRYNTPHHKTGPDRTVPYTYCTWYNHAGQYLAITGPDFTELRMAITWHNTSIQNMASQLRDFILAYPTWHYNYCTIHHITLPWLTFTGPFRAACNTAIASHNHTMWYLAITRRHSYHSWVRSA